MFDLDRSGTIDFNEFWYEAHSITCIIPLANTSLKRLMGLPHRLAQALRPIRRGPLERHLLRRVPRRLDGVWVQVNRRLSELPVQYLRYSEDRPAKLRHLRAMLHQSETDDGGVQEI